MKIAIFTDVYAPEINGVSTSIQNSTRILAQKGHEILIFCPKYEGYHEKKLKNIRIKRYSAFSFATNKATRIAFPALGEILTILKRFKPDVVHIHTPMNVGVAGIIASKMAKLPNIQTYHTYIPDFMVYLEPKNFLKLDKLKKEIETSKTYAEEIGEKDKTTFKTALKELKEDIKSLNQALKLVREKEKKKEKIKLKTRFAWNYTRLLYNRADLVLTPSHALKADLERHEIEAPVAVQTNGIETKEFKVKKNYSLKKKILHIGRLGPEKNIDIILKAMAIVVKKDKEVILDIIGDGPERKYLEGLSRELGISGNVNFLGFMDRKKLLPQIKDYDIFVTASTIETQGLVILESMASGLPIIGVDRLAIPEAVKNGQNGYVVSIGDAKKMAEMIGILFGDAGMREKMGKASVKLASSHELAGAVRHLEGIYQKIAAKKNA